MNDDVDHNISLSFYRTCSPSEISSIVSTTIPQDQLPATYLASLNDADRTVCFRASMICWTVSKSTMVPREMQLRTVVADSHGKDVLIAAGTGSGKTLPLALCILLDDPAEQNITITISPLKRLQLSQESDFNTQFGIPTVTINEDTPRDTAWWEEHVFSTKTRQAGKAQHLIVTVEQLFKSNAGHFGPLGNLIRNSKAFRNKLKRVNVDEAHFIRTVGIPLYGCPAFRPSWGKLEELRACLPKDVQWKALSATFPLHILKVVEKILKPGYETIQISSNRPNTTYATHVVPGSIEDPQNYECFLTSPFNLDSQPHVLIFVDDKALTTKIAHHLNSLLEPLYRDLGIVRHYHSAMSEQYLQQTHLAFDSEEYLCRILVATSGESVGIDFSNVKIVCTAGFPSSMVEVLQRAGRAARRLSESALFVMFCERWALDIEEKDFMGDMSDPDRPRTDLHASSKARDRAPLSGIKFVQSKTCLRRFFADYLNDKSSEALDFVTQFCCDRHDNGFNLEASLPNFLYSGAINFIAVEGSGSRTARYRPTWERSALDQRLMSWAASEASRNDEYRLETYNILSQAQRKVLVTLPFENLISASNIRTILRESVEWANDWAEKIYQLIVDFQRNRPPKP